MPIAEWLSLKISLHGFHDAVFLPIIVACVIPQVAVGLPHHHGLRPQPAKSLCRYRIDAGLQLLAATRGNLLLPKQVAGIPLVDLSELLSGTATTLG